MEHVGRRRRRRQRPPPAVLENPPPTLIPEDVHTSPFKGGNPNSDEKLRPAPLGVPLRERTIHHLSSPYKSSTNELVNVGNGEVVRLVNLSLDFRCQSLTVQEFKPRTRHLTKQINQLNKEALRLAMEAQAKSDEVAAMGGKAVEVGRFLLIDPEL